MFWKLLWKNVLKSDDAERTIADNDLDFAMLAKDVDRDKVVSIKALSCWILLVRTRLTTRTPRSTNAGGNRKVSQGV